MTQASAASDSIESTLPPSSTVNKPAFVCDPELIRRQFPAELQASPHWVLTHNKIPYNPSTGRKASSTDPSTWTSFEKAVAAFQSRVKCDGHEPDGVGFVFTENDRYCGVDLDDCVDDKGRLTTQAESVLIDLDSYSERSPSGKGVHVFVKATKPEGGNKKVFKDKAATGMKAIEIYDRVRYFTVTGNALEQYPNRVHERQQEIDTIHAAVFGKAVEPTVAEEGEPSSGFPGTDEELIAAIRVSKQGPKFTKLWDGDINGYGSQSDADAALMCILAFWAGNDPTRMEQLFAQSKLAARDKWKRADYRRETIQFAIDKTKTVYQPKPARKSKGPGDEQILAALQSDFEYTHGGSTMDIPYVTFEKNGHKETHQVSLKGSRVEQELTLRFLRAHDRAPKEAALSQTMRTILARCMDGKVSPVYIRVACLPAENKIYVDLADAERRAIEITPDGWSVVTNVPVRFVRPMGMLPLPVPTRGGSLEDFRPLVNAADPDVWILMKAFLVGILQPTGPVPHLALTGTKSSLKTTTATLTASLINPSELLKATPPKDEQTAVITVMNLGCVAFFDNISWITDPLSDMLCQFSTGGVYQTRTLFSTMDLTAIKLRISVILNGIDSFIRREDLLERTIVALLPKIDPTARLTEEEVLTRFEQVWPGCLGALLDAVAVGLKNRGTTRVSNPPRMADFCHWVVACEPAMGWQPGEFLRAYRESQVIAENLLIEGDAVASAILEWAKKVVGGDGYEGSPAQILEGLNTMVDGPRDKKWPANGQALGHRLNRLQDPLRSKGLNVTRRRDRQGVLWQFQWLPEQIKLFAQYATSVKQQEEEAVKAAVEATRPKEVHSL